MNAEDIVLLRAVIVLLVYVSIVMWAITRQTVMTFVQEIVKIIFAIEIMGRVLNVKTDISDLFVCV